MTFQWDDFSKGIAKELAKAAGLPGARAAEELATKYVGRPTGALVTDLWPVMRDGWLAKRPGVRLVVGARLRKAGLGDKSIDTSTKLGEAEYGRSCRLWKPLKTIVLDALINESLYMSPISNRTRNSAAESKTQDDSKNTGEPHLKAYAHPGSLPEVYRARSNAMKHYICSLFAPF